jgi:hypothetical protein
MRASQYSSFSKNLHRFLKNFVGPRPWLRGHVRPLAQSPASTYRSRDPNVEAVRPQTSHRFNPNEIEPTACAHTARIGVIPSPSRRTARSHRARADVLPASRHTRSGSSSPTTVRSKSPTTGTSVLSSSANAWGISCSSAASDAAPSGNGTRREWGGRSTSAIFHCGAIETVTATAGSSTSRRTKTSAWHAHVPTPGARRCRK